MRSLTLYWSCVAALGVLGLLIDSSYLLHILILVLIWSIVVAAWDLLMGYAGVLNFAQLVFFAVGGYGSQMIAMQIGVSAIEALILSSLVAGLFGLLVGLPCLRLQGEYVALFTFAVHLAFPTLLQQGRPFGTGGSGGLMGSSPLEIAGFSLSSTDKVSWYFTLLIIAALCIWLVYFVILRGKWGRAFVVLRDSPQSARSLGVNELSYKLLVFTLSAAITGLAGGLYTHYVGVITPNVLGNEFFLIVMVMLCVGGLGRFPGVLIGALVITLGNEFLRDFGQYRLIILGLAVIITLRFLPHGLAEPLQYFSGRVKSAAGRRP